MKKRIRYLFIFTIICAILTLGFVLSKIISESTPSLQPVAENTIEVPRLCQHPELPSGCEATAAVMVLRYYGDEVRLVDFAEEWLTYSEDFYTADGKDFGPDPNQIFAGNPFSEYAYGCYAPAIVRAINENSDLCGAKEITGTSLEQLCEDYIEKDRPVLIWATMNMKDSEEGKTWYFEDGNKFTWISQEHCLVLVGYDEDYYFFNDPESGNVVAYNKDVVEEKFEELGSQAVYIYKK